MGFNLGNAVTTVATGGLNKLWDAIQPNTITQDQVPLETPEQSAARKKLMEFANTGVFGKFTAGEDLGLGYGDYGVTPTEQTGLSSLQELLNSGIPSQYSLGDEALKSMLTTDPNQIAAQFDPFKTQVERQIKDSTNAAKRSGAYMGNLYSSDQVKQFGDIQARGNETLASQLANLTNESLNRRLQAIPLAYQSAKAQEENKLNRIAASQQYGALTRQLNDASIKARDAEILRKRQELGLPITAASNVAGQNANFGVPSVTTSEPSTMMNLLNLLVQGGSRLASARGGA